MSEIGEELRRAADRCREGGDRSDRGWVAADGEEFAALADFVNRAEIMAEKFRNILDENFKEDREATDGGWPAELDFFDQVRSRLASVLGVGDEDT